VCGNLIVYEIIVLVADTLIAMEGENIMARQDSMSKQVALGQERKKVRNLNFITDFINTKPKSTPI
jgi:hypothetical protein